MRPFGIEPIVHLEYAALLIERANRVVRGWYPKITEPSSVELRRVVAHNLLQHEGRRPGADRESIGLRPIVKMVSGDDAAGAGHVLHNPGWITRQVSADIASNNASVKVE